MRQDPNQAERLKVKRQQAERLRQHQAQLNHQQRLLTWRAKTRESQTEPGTPARYKALQAIGWAELRGEWLQSPPQPPAALPRDAANSLKDPTNCVNVWWTRSDNTQLTGCTWVKRFANQVRKEARTKQIPLLWNIHCHNILIFRPIGRVANGPEQKWIEMLVKQIGIYKGVLVLGNGPFSVWIDP